MNIELIIDNREHKLINLLESSTNIIIERLPIGDILFRKNGDPIFIIERKTISDLKCSICDGRHREQKARLLGSSILSNRIMYIIEG